MNAEFAESIRLIIQEKGISTELMERVVSESLLAAFKKTYGTSDNGVVKVEPDFSKVTIAARKEVVADDDLYDPVAEIELKDARLLNEEAEIGDEILVDIDLDRDLDRSAVQMAKQRFRQNLKDIQKDTLYAEFKDKVGEVIIGYYQRERNGNIFIDLGKTEGILPKKNQSPRETYGPNSRIKCLIQEVKKTPTGLQIVLSRKDPDFVKRIFELEVPELYEQVIIIHKIVREAGYRTKIAVKSTREDIDPIGACVGMKGVRIQAVMKELEGERIDVLKYDPDPREFIRNALSPASVNQVVILDESKKSALAIVPDSQLSLAIGKQGLNVKLANRLADWNIDVKTEEQFAEMDISQETRAAAADLFRDDNQSSSNDGFISQISELSGVSERVVDILAQNGIVLIEDLVNISRADLEKLEGMTTQDVATLMQIVEENVDIVEEGSQAEDSDEETQTADESEEFECPDCGHAVKIDMTSCPNCGVGLSFEIEEESEE